MKILIVDDDIDVVRPIERWLRLSRHDVCWAASGPAAIGLLEQEANFGLPIDLALVDVHLGSGFDGVELCNRMRAHPFEAIRGCDVIIVTGDTASSVRNIPVERARSVADSLVRVQIIITKPIDLEHDLVPALRLIERAR